MWKNSSSLSNIIRYWLYKHIVTFKKNRKIPCFEFIKHLYTATLKLFSSFTSYISDSLWSHGLQHASLPYPSSVPRACLNSCPLNHWCHPTISSSVVPFSSCLQSFPASESYLMTHLFISGGQSIGGLASTSVLPMNIQDFFFFFLGFTGLIL